VLRLSDNIRSVDQSWSIEDFRGDFGNVATLIQRSWSENSKQPLFYSADFVESSFKYPGASLSLAPTLYNGSNPVAFAAGFPRHVRLKGCDLHVIVSTFLSVSPAYKKRGYGIVLWSELVRRAQRAGFDGMVNFCVDGEPMNGMVEGCAKMLRLPIKRIFSAHYRSYLLRPLQFDEQGYGAETETIHEFLQLAAVIAEHTPLARLWSREEAEWQCARRYGVITARHVVGSRSGMLTGYVMQVCRRDYAKCLLVEDVLWGTLASDERQALLRELLQKAGASGVRIVTVPILGYADMEPFAAAGFQRSRRIVHGYLTIWHGEAASEVLPSIYLDVF
jgi:GNAT superfamily N-acetyltransferase